MSRQLIGIIFIVAILFGCKPLKKVGISGYAMDDLSKENYKKLSGNYSNYPETAIGKTVDFPYARPAKYLSLFDQFVTGVEIDDKNYLAQQIVMLNFVSPNRVRAKLFKRDSLIETKLLRGKIKGHYFYSRPKILILPVVPLLFGYEFKRYRIGLSSDYLIVDYSTKRWLYLLLSSGTARKGYFSSAYKRK